MVAMEYNYNMGLIIFIINVAILISCSIGIYFRFHSAVQAETKKETDFHFALLLAMVAFFIANVFAFYTGYKAYIISPSNVRSDIIPYRLADRSIMLFVSVILLFVGKLIRGVFKEEE